MDKLIDAGKLKNIQLNPLSGHSIYGGINLDNITNDEDEFEPTEWARRVAEAEGEDINLVDYNKHYNKINKEPYLESIIIAKNCKNLEDNNNIQNFPKQYILLKSLLEFYRNENIINIVVPIIKQETSISLRSLDWLVTNYSRTYNIRYSLTNNDDKINILDNFNIWKEYKNQLKAYSKKYFDPFCRRQRIFLDIKNNIIILLTKKNINTYIENNNGFITTVGQLNFFKWAIKNKVLKYAFEHKNEIEKDMLLSAEHRSKKKQSGNNKRMLSKNNNSANCYKIGIIIKF